MGDIKEGLRALYLGTSRSSANQGDKCSEPLAITLYTQLYRNPGKGPAAPSSHSQTQLMIRMWECVKCDEGGRLLPGIYFSRHDLQLADRDDGRITCNRCR